MTEEKDTDGQLRRIAGFRITGMLGRGAMGVVYKARQVSLDREVALKVLQKSSVADSSYIARFLREARNAARLQHPHIVQAIDVGEDDTFCYFAMELIVGHSVKDMLRLRGRLPVEEAVLITRQIAAALDYAWKHAGMIHRDVKPSNILIDQHGNAKLVDMGLAKSTQDTLITTHGAVLGTLAYMSPEQLQDAELIDHRSDIYALGCTLYQMLTGRTPFDSRSRVGVVTGHLSQPVPDPRELVDEVPESLAHYTMRMMCKHPEERPQSGTEIELFMEEVLDELGYDETEHNTQLLENFRRLFGGQSGVSAAQAEYAREHGLPPTRTLELPGKIPLKLVLIQPGSFPMGSPADEEGRNDDEGPMHTVQITRPFYMGVYPVTQEQYTAVTDQAPSRFPGEYNPVERVSWLDAVDFCKKLGELCGRPVRLPTEAEWEYACRAGTTTRFCFGDDLQYLQLDNHAWYADNSSFRTHKVGQKEPTPWHLYDMHGNVWEWCVDWYGESYYAASARHDPAGPSEGPGKVTRGGSCLYFPKFLRSANRSWSPPHEQSGNIGFRIRVEADGDTG